MTMGCELVIEWDSIWIEYGDENKTGEKKYQSTPNVGHSQKMNHQ